MYSAQPRQFLMVMYITMRLSGQYSRIPCAVQCSAVQCSAVQCSAVQCSAVQYSAVQCSAVQCSAVQYSAVQCSAVQCSAIQCSTVVDSAVSATWSSRSRLRLLAFPLQEARTDRRMMA